MNTKEQIIEEALKLFSERGYNNVSVRDIAYAVGIKESSLYYHFKNKQDIFDTIVDICYEKAKTYFKKNALPFDDGDSLSIYSNIDITALTELIFATFIYFFEDQYNVMFRKLLIISQFENKRAMQIYRQLYYKYPIDFQCKIFKMLMDSGEFRQENPKIVAVEFYSVIYMLLHTCDHFEEAKPILEEHVRQFIAQYHI